MNRETVNRIINDTLTSQGIKTACNVAEIALFDNSQDNGEALAVASVLDFVVNGGKSVHTIPICKDGELIGHATLTLDTFPLN